MITTQACGINIFPYFLQELRGISLAVGEFVREARKALLETNGFVSVIHWSLELLTPTATYVHTTLQNQYLPAQFVCVKHLMFPSPLIISFNTLTFVDAQNFLHRWAAYQSARRSNTGRINVCGGC